MNKLLDDLQILFGKLGGPDPSIPFALPNGTDMTSEALLYRAFNKMFQEHPGCFERADESPAVVGRVFRGKQQPT